MLAYSVPPVKGQRVHLGLSTKEALSCGPLRPITTKRTHEWQSAQELHAAHQATIPFAAMLLLESALREGFTGAHEDLPHLPADLLR
jgi:hypothetical protein